MSLEEEKLNEVISLLSNLIALQKQGAERHEEEHEYLRVLIEEHKTRKETWLSIQRRVVSGTVWAATVAVFSAIIFTAKNYFTGGL